jgi:acyl-coenzyme A synthetase/AMP-(fatty) acid ligase
MSGGSVPSGYRVFPPKVNMYAETVGRSLSLGHGEKPALVWDSGMLTYSALDHEVARVSAGLAGAGVKRGDAVLLRSNNSAPYVIMTLAVFRLGAVAIMTSSLLQRDEVAYILENSEARIAASPDALSAPLRDLLSDGALDCLVLLDADAQSDAILGFNSFSPDDDAIVPIADTDASEHAFMVYSSGTTGKPKGILHAQKWVITLGDPVVLHNEYEPGDVTMTPGEFSFMGTFGNNLIGPLRAGATIVLFGERATPRAVLEAVAKYKVNKFLSVPTLYRRILAEVGVEDGLDLSSVSYFISAGESLGSAVPEAWSQRFSFPLYEIYGVSEVMTCIANTRYNPVKWGSMGKALPGLRLAIMNEHLEPVSPGETGRLMIHRDDPGMFLCYYKQWEKWCAAHKGDWYDTGDVMHHDEEGYFYYHGRKDDLFKSRGYFISPQEVENALLRHNDVAEAAVIGVPDENYGNRIEAYVRLGDGRNQTDALASEIIAFVGQHLAPYKVPKTVSFVDEIPKNAVGKILRRALTG